jgi:hypothetical protein
MAVSVCPADCRAEVRRLMGRLDRQFHDGVADSLQRIKRTAQDRAR